MVGVTGEIEAVVGLGTGKVTGAPTESSGRGGVATLADGEPAVGVLLPLSAGWDGMGWGTGEGEGGGGASTFTSIGSTSMLRSAKFSISIVVLVLKLSISRMVSKHIFKDGEGNKEVK